MRITAFTDGASRGNPGEAAIGIILKDDAGTTVMTHGKYLGTATNNIAEYTALLECVRLVKNSGSFQCSELIVRTDSELMARQMNGQYKVKDAGMKRMYDQVKQELSTAPFRFSIGHVPRALNKEADALANEAIDSKL